MLGRLARWLRVAGLDTLYGPDFDDRELVRRAAAEERVLLTRDRHLVEHLRPARALLVRSQAPLEQLREVVAAFGPGEPPGLFTRCLVCNTPLLALDPAEGARRRPQRSRGVPGPVMLCPACDRVYWHGSHVRRMRDALARAIPAWFA